ncbi:MAG: lipoate--protein ligase family protein [Asgard group archaeon]|nr:lipoate--protein ligase family protein [Asgard group archaeon]
MNVRRSFVVIMKVESFKVRLLRDDIKDPFRHFAAEEALLRLVEEGRSPPTLRIRTFERSVWIGVHQIPEEDVDVEYCKKEQIPIVRRPNPGGAVYQDAGSFCYSFFFKTDDFFTHLEINDPSTLYQLFGKVIVNTCHKFGVEAETAGRNDVTINNRKVYGSAQNQLYDAFVHSGTFLVNVDIEQMAKTLKPSKLKFSDKGFTNIKDRVINLSEAVNKKLELDDVIDVLVNTIKEQINVTFDPVTSNYTKEEEELIENLYQNKYSTIDWTFRKKASLETILSRKTDYGIISLGLEMANDKIAKLTISGDFLFKENELLIKLIQTLQNKTIPEATTLITESNLPSNFKYDIISLIEESVVKNQ